MVRNELVPYLNFMYFIIWISCICPINRTCYQWIKVWVKIYQICVSISNILGGSGFPRSKPTFYFWLSNRARIMFCRKIMWPCYTKKLDSVQALRLFSYHALRREKPTDEFLNLSKQIVTYRRITFGSGSIWCLSVW